MKATGIVRRIDDLGRVVLPKEIRKTMRIREGDPLEIYTDEGGSIIFKKYSQMESSAETVQALCDALYKASSTPCAICDRGHILSTSGIKDSLISSHISTDTEKYMSGRSVVTLTSPCPMTDDSDTDIHAIAPVITGGDIVGAVMFTEKAPNDSDIKLLGMASGFLSRFFE
ncbi:MAG: AbrB/MazE/SpoVT family DNA-binding domain-containing protein [Ruminococcaceae bacterium]|nr:AbrB/MazE/SpoVT family DNA-binding domain-containing protein [Oscillospiraceae bacterium]